MRAATDTVSNAKSSVFDYGCEEVQSGLVRSSRPVHEHRQSGAGAARWKVSGLPDPSGLQMDFIRLIMEWRRHTDRRCNTW